MRFASSPKTRVILANVTSKTKHPNSYPSVLKGITLNHAPVYLQPSILIRIFSRFMSERPREYRNVSS